MRLKSIGFAAALAVTSMQPAVAQDHSRAVDASLDQIEAYYSLYGAQRLVQAQLTLRAGRYYDGPLDGQWGQGTQAAFEAVIETLIAINGGPEFVLVRDPDAVPGVTDWVAGGVLAEGGYQEFPD